MKLVFPLLPSAPVTARRPFPTFFYGLLVLATLAFLSGCGPAEGDRATAVAVVGQQTTRLDLPIEVARERVAAALPWEQYVTNTYLPTAGAEKSTKPLLERPLRVALPWLPNDQTPALWVALGRGYFEEEGISVEVVPGGPGRDNLILALSGHVDLAIGSSTTGIIRMVTSETGGKLVALGALQKQYPYAYIALDETIPADTRSTRELTAADFRGKTLGMTPGGELFLNFALARLGLDPSEISIQKAGASLTPLLSGVYDYYTTMADNNPRRLEAMGHHNWMLWRFSDHGWIDYHNVITTRPAFLEAEPATIRAFLRALDRGLQAVLADEAQAAQEILPLLGDTDLTVPLIERRLELQRPITAATEEEPLLHLTLDRWIDSATMLWRHGAINLPETKE